jgi:hypothetical protein
MFLVLNLVSTALFAKDLPPSFGIRGFYLSYQDLILLWLINDPDTTARKLFLRE